MNQETRRHHTTMEKRLTEENYKQLLLNRFGDPEIKFVKADIKPLSENNEGFMGAHFKLKLTYSKEGVEQEENLFVKTKPFDATADHPTNADNIYDKEIFFYDLLFKEFEKLGYETNFSPKCYLCVNGETLIMEDMSEQDFYLPKRQAYYDIKKVKALLKSLALLHAGSYAFEKTKSTELGKQYSIVEEHPLAITGKGFGTDWFKSSIINFKNIIDLLPKDEAYKTKFKQLLDEAEFGKVFVEDHGIKKICTHGDLWSNNMMFKCSGEKAEACCLVDYQVSRYFYPAFDVLLATHFNTDEEFCKNNLEEMYQYYYNTLSDAIKQYGYSVEEFLSLQDFRKSLELCKADAMIQVASVNSMIFVPADALDKFIKGRKLATKGNEDIKAADQMKEMMKEFFPTTFKNDEIYRKDLKKNLYHLYDALEQKYCKNSD